MQDAALAMSEPEASLQLLAPALNRLVNGRGITNGHRERTHKAGIR